MPAAISLLIASEEITSSLFGYGSFDKLSVKKSAEALFYFALGLPAFSFIKIFSSFLFARNNTKIPFYFSLFSVIINITISLYFFNEIGFIIIPIATTISSWLNSLLLLFFLNKKNYFSLNLNLIIPIFKIVFSTILTSMIFYYLINFFADNLDYESEFKLLTIILLVIVTLIAYILISVLTKAFKISDIKLKY